MEVDATLVDEFTNLDRNNPEFVKKCAKLAQDIKTEQLTIVQLVEQLGALLVDVAPSNRELGTWILTTVLEDLPPNFFDTKQLNFISTFYADRLKDHHQVIPAVLTGILALANFENFPEGAASAILRVLFQNVSCQQQQEQDRRNIYKIFEVLLDRFGTELCAMGLDYVYGVISAVDGERNPKNLILLFNWFPKFLKTVNLGHLREEAFEVLACYFPVDFKAPTQDPNSITRDQLADLLAPCLTSIPEFAEFCLSLALEKLDSSLEIAKLDSLKLIERGCLTFETSSFVQHSTEIWSQIQKEIFSGPTKLIENACLITLTTVIKKISSDSCLGSTVKDILDTVKGNLLPDSKLFGPSAKILLNVSKASKASSDIIIREIVPILINQFNITSSVGHKVILLKIMVDFFDSYVSFRDKIEFEEVGKIPMFCVKSSIDQNWELRKTGFDGLRQISKFLPEEVRVAVYNNLKQLLLISQPDDVKNSILNCFEKLSRNFPSEIGINFIDNFELISDNYLENYLNALCKIAPEPFFTDKVISIIINYLINPSQSKMAIKILKNLLLEHENDEKIQSMLIEKNVISNLINWALSEENLAIETLENISFILKSVIGYQTSEKQSEIISHELVKISVFSTTCIFLLDGLLSRLRLEVKMTYELFNILTAKFRQENDNSVKNVVVQLLANLINKCQDENALQIYLSQFSNNEPDVMLMGWITKALVMRNHQLAHFWTEKLLKALKEDKKAATSFRIIINDNFDSLSRKSYCLSSLLYQQKFFTIVSNKLNEQYRPEYPQFLVALGYLLENAPKKAVLLQFKKILKLIILCLDGCEEKEIIIVILQILKEFIVKKESCIEDHFSDFLTRFLNLSTWNKSMEVRILALQCLQESTTSFPLYKLLPYKQEVLLTLGKVIDDKKRIVRREAVEARSLWFLLDAPI